MGKYMSKVFHLHQWQWLKLGQLFATLKKRTGKARILASVVVETKKQQKVRAVICPPPP